MPIGIDRQLTDQFDPELSIKRIRNDLQSDFIYSPHISSVFHQASDELLDRLLSKLNSGNYDPRLPITIEAPKKSGFTRPGSILWPFERLAYQLVVDRIAPIAEDALDRNHVFSYQLLTDDSDGFMFKPASESFTKFREKVLTFSQSGAYSHVFITDVSSFFERLYQHALINLLTSTGCDPIAVNFLEKLLLLFTQKDSHGIIQGVFPSDFLGNFYLLSLDTAHLIESKPFLRYVDDVYMFWAAESEAAKHRIEVTKLLRKDGLNLNESKSRIVKVEDLIHEETEVDTLFEKAKDEVWSDLTRADFYSSTIAWDYEEPDEEAETEIDLIATKELFEYESTSQESRDKIDKFCLSIFTAAKDDHAVDYVLDNYTRKPYLAQQFAKYLKPYAKSNPSIVKRLEFIYSSSEIIYEYQTIWLLALLLTAETLELETVNKAYYNLTERKYSDALRAIGALMVAKYGNAGQRRLLKNYYQDEPSPYVRASILYSARYFPKGERDACYAAWGGHDETNSLIVVAAKRM